MSILDPNAFDPGTAAPADGSTGSIRNLEGLAGLIEDMMTAELARTAANLEEIVKTRLGPNATIEDAKRLMVRLWEIDDSPRAATTA